MKKVKLIITMLSCMLLLSILAPGTSQVIYASENDDSIETNKMFQPEKITILDSNNLYKAFVNEINSPEMKEQIALHEESQKTIDLIQSLIVKYDGAEVKMCYAVQTLGDYIVPLGNGWSEKFVNGGINEYATTKAGLANLRDYLGGAAVGFAVNGAAYGAVIGGVMGAVVGVIIGAGILSNRCNQGQADIKVMINKGRTKGGVRLTLTAEFPICSLDSQTQCAI
ncbi:glycine zipper family protein [Enterococcus thailandicus]|uniref:glycine zipper family protein n=1 Tax=Enterococcus thailandicus TaxID=417368 RepID=UPI001FD2E1C3|nr:glycine zipper family protein [Enterococcus thailandicus]MDT2750975.1 glycine zipper family protein [Enterococcus thailandicus]MDT2775698.1 glycine zipper family protein [Enterococcus thailandicus]MDT2794560.1 glycine zipper family protein [Enterococcus thailandicus]